MAKYLLEQIKIEGVLVDLIAQSNGDNVKVTVGGNEKTLAAALAGILTDIAALPTSTDVNTAVSTAIDALIDGAPGTYDTLKEIADYIAAHADVVTALNEAIGNKVDKVEGMSLISDALITKLEGLKKVEASGTNGNIKIDGEEVNVYTHPTGEGNKHVPAGGTEGQVLTKTADGYAFADAPAGVRHGTSVPDDMRNGELFVRIVD